MTAGAYLLSDDLGAYAVERFSCGAGPAGWRYVATREQPGTGAPLGRLDVVVDAHGAAVRVAVQAAGWLLRGGVVGAEVLWRRGADERSAVATGFTGSSPVWVLAATRRLTGPAAALRLVRLGDEALSTTLVDQRWTSGRRQDHDGLEVWHHEVADLATGRAWSVGTAGDLVVHAPGTRLLEVSPPAP